MGPGHNAHVAWGFTSGLSDDNDLYAERAGRTGVAALSVPRARADDVVPARGLPLPRRRRHPRGAEDPVPQRARPRPGRVGARRLRPPLRALEARGRDHHRADRAQRREQPQGRRPRPAPGELEREHHRRRRPRRHRLLAPRPAPAAPAGLGRAPAVPGHRRGRVARPAAARARPARDQPARAQLGRQLEQRAVRGLDFGRRPGARAPQRSLPPHRRAPSAGQRRGAGSDLRRASASASSTPTRSPRRSSPPRCRACAPRPRARPAARRRC